MDTKNQIVFFALSVAIGFVGGIAYEPFAFLRLLFGCSRGKRKSIGIALDILFGLTFALLSLFSAFYLHFPAVRGYIWLGYAVGGIIYLKSLRRIVAFFENLCYNRVVKWTNRAKLRIKNRRKEKIKRKKYGKNDYDTRKNEEFDYGNRRSGYDPSRVFARRFDLSVDNDRDAEQARTKIGTRKRATATNH